MGTDSSKILTNKNEIENFFLENNIKKEHFPATSEEMIDEFYRDNCRAKIYHMGMYAVKDSDGSVSWRVWSPKNEYVDSCTAYTENSTLQQVFLLLGQPDTMNVLRSVIEESLGHHSVSIRKIADRCGMNTDSLLKSLSALKTYGLVMESDKTDEKEYSVSPEIIEGFVLLMTGGYILVQKEK